MRHATHMNAQVKPAMAGLRQVVDGLESPSPPSCGRCRRIGSSFS